VTEVNHLNLSG